MPVPPIRFSYVSGDGQQIAAYRWDPPGPPVAAMQLTHGMGEHALRYDQLALAEWADRVLAGHGQDVS